MSNKLQELELMLYMSIELQEYNMLHMSIQLQEFQLNIYEYWHTHTHTHSCMSK